MGVLDTLTPREKKVLSLRFGLEDGRQRTLEEVGQEFNVTRERIRQIEAKALRKLRPSEPQQKAERLSGVNKVSKWDAEAFLFKWNVIHVKRLKNGRNMENLHVYGENGAYISRFFVKNTFFRAFRQPKPLTLCTCGDTIEPLRFEAVLPQSSRKTDFDGG